MVRASDVQTVSHIKAVYGNHRQKDKRNITHFSISNDEMPFAQCTTVHIKNINLSIKLETSNGILSTHGSYFHSV